MDKKYERKNRLREALSIRGMKQIELCEKTGIKKASVNGWVSQRWQPKQDSLFKMAQALEVSEMWLAGYDVPMERKKEVIPSPDITIEIEGNRLDYDKLKHLFKYMTELNPEQLDTIESLVNQLHTLNKKGDINE